MLLNSNKTIIEIAKQAALPDPVEQHILLTKLRVKRSLKQIDKWKHGARRKS